VYTRSHCRPCCCADLGYADNEVSEQVFSNATRIPTPNMERMANGGMKFPRGYSGQGMCLQSSYPRALFRQLLSLHSIAELEACNLVRLAVDPTPLNTQLCWTNLIRYLSPFCVPDVYSVRTEPVHSDERTPLGTLHDQRQRWGVFAIPGHR
jgi:hypothetical protein